MKILGKIIPLFLTAAVFASCSSRISPPTVSSTDVMETSLSFARTEMVETLTAIPTSAASSETPTSLPVTQIPPTQTIVFPIPFDRHDPEAVLRAYLDAWNRNDWLTQNALTFGRPLEPEPVDSLEVLEVKSLSSSSTKCVYSVRFEIKVKGQGVSMHSGKYFWKYYLIWDPNRDSWYITGYRDGYAP